MSNIREQIVKTNCVIRWIREHWLHKIDVRKNPDLNDIVTKDGVVYKLIERPPFDDCSIVDVEAFCTRECELYTLIGDLRPSVFGKTRERYEFDESEIERCSGSLGNDYMVYVENDPVHYYPSYANFANRARNTFLGEITTPKEVLEIRIITEDSEDILIKNPFSGMLQHFGNEWIKYHVMNLKELPNDVLVQKKIKIMPTKMCIKPHPLPTGEMRTMICIKDYHIKVVKP